jgi:tetratricopeptide (TPR) repeat protein
LREPEPAAAAARQHRHGAGRAVRGDGRQPARGRRRHFTEAGLAGEAIGYWLKAGRLASARWANREAVASFEQALHLLEAQPQTRETVERAIDLRFELRTSLLPLGEFERIFSHLHEAEGLAKSLHDQPRLAQVSALMCHYLWMKGQPKEALAFGQNARAIAESLGDVPLQVMGNLQLGAACMWVADYPRAEDRLLRVLKLLEGDLGGKRSGLAASAAVAVRGYLTVVFAGQGKFEEALSQEGSRLAESLHLSYDLAGVSIILAGIDIARGNLSRAIGLLECGRPSKREWNPILSDNYTARQGYAYALSGRTAEGIPLFEQALRASEAMGYGLMQPAFMMYLGEAYVLADRLDEALTLTGRALTLARKHGRRGDEARALCLLGEVNARHNPPDRAQGHYREALALAEELGMRPLVAHCHLGLGKLYQRTGARRGPPRISPPRRRCTSSWTCHFG